MTTTLNKIREHSLCIDGWEKLLKYLGKTKADDEPLPLLTILDSNGLEDALWCLRAVNGYEAEMRQFARWCAAQNIEKIKPYTTPEGYNLIVRWLETGDESIRADAESAASAAWSAAWSAAQSAAESAERSAAWSAAWSAARGSIESELRRILGDIMTPQPIPTARKALEITFENTNLGNIEHEIAKGIIESAKLGFTSTEFTLKTKSEQELARMIFKKLCDLGYDVTADDIISGFNFFIKWDHLPIDDGGDR